MKPNKLCFLFQYNPKNTGIHRLPAGVKFWAICFSSFILYNPSQFILASYALCLLVISMYAKVSFITVKKQCRFLCLYAICIFCIKIAGMPFSADVYKRIALESLFFLQKLTLILFTASLFYETTSRLELFMLCERIERFFCKEKYTCIFSNLFTITLMCVPKVFELWALLNYAYDARTAIQRHGIINAYQRLAFLLPALIENLLGFAFTAEKALKNRS